MDRQIERLEEMKAALNELKTVAWLCACEAYSSDGRERLSALEDQITVLCDEVERIISMESTIV